MSSGYEHPLHDWLVRHGYTPHRLARLAGISPHTVRRILLGHGCRSDAVDRLVAASHDVAADDPIRVGWLIERPRVRALKLNFSTPWSEWWPMKRP